MACILITNGCDSLKCILIITRSFPADLHDIESLRGVDEDAVQHIQHAGALASGAQAGEQPVEAVAVGELGAVGMVTLNHRRQQLVQVSCQKEDHSCEHVG